MLLKRKTKDIGRVLEKEEFYPTPKNLCLEALKLIPNVYTAQYALDPGAGDGVWGNAFRKLNKHANLLGIEKRLVPFPFSSYDSWWVEIDYLKCKVDNNYDIIFGNPPYSLAEEFIRKGISELEQGGYLIFLLRLAFLESAKRHFGLFTEFPPKEVSVLSRRPSFYGGKTNATAYALFIWQEGYKGKTNLTWTHYD
jgi:hypothetical protein